MKWIGVTGGVGCGKSTVLNFFKSLGYGVVSADAIVHDLYQRSDVVQKISKLLGIPKASFSRNAVAEVVFSDVQKLKDLEAILHPLIRLEVQKKKSLLEKKGVDLAFYEVPLLFENSMQKLFDQTLCIGAHEDIQIKRLQKRNSWSKKETKARISVQMPLEDKKKLADFYIDNSGAVEDLEKACRSFLNQVLL